MKLRFCATRLKNELRLWCSDERHRPQNSDSGRCEAVPVAVVHAHDLQDHRVRARQGLRARAVVPSASHPRSQRIHERAAHAQGVASRWRKGETSKAYVLAVALVVNVDRRTFNLGAILALLTIGCEMDERKMERLVAAAERIAKSLEKMERRMSIEHMAASLDPHLNPEQVYLLQGKSDLPFQVVDEADLEFDDDGAA